MTRAYRFRPTTREELSLLHKQKGLGLDALNQPGASYCLEVDGEALAYGGVLLLCQGVAEGWFTVGERAREHRFALFRTTRRLLEKVRKDLKLHRIEARVLKGSKRSLKWAHVLGFEAEGLLRRANTKQEDFHLLSRIYASTPSN